MSSPRETLHKRMSDAKVDTLGASPAPEVKDFLDFTKLEVNVDSRREQLANLLQKIHDALYDSHGKSKDFLNYDGSVETLVKNFKGILGTLNKVKHDMAAAQISGKPPNAVRLGATLKEVDAAVNTALKELKEYVSDFKDYLSISQQADVGLEKRNEGKRLPGHMLTIKEAVEYLENAIERNEYYGEVKDLYFKEIPNVPDLQTRSEYKLRKAIQEIAVSGDTGIPAFDIYFPAIQPELQNNEVGFIDMARALFLKRPAGKENEVFKEGREVDQFEIDEAAIEMWDYIVKRIKHKPEWGGINSDPLDPPGEEGQFSYPKLFGENVVAFKKHLHQKFAHIEKRKRDLLLKFYENFDIKTVAYIPHQMREQTRAHGFPPPHNPRWSGDSFKDQTAALNRWALGQYGKTRYANVDANASSEQYLYLSEEIIPEIMKDPHNHTKLHTAIELWEDVELYRKQQWGKVIQAVEDVRRMMVVRRGDEEIAPHEIDLNSTIFPAHAEVVINVLKVEIQKRKILEKKTRAEEARIKGDTALAATLEREYEEESATLVEQYLPMGYSLSEKIEGKTPAERKIKIEEAFRTLGLEKIRLHGINQYQVAFDKWEAVDDLFEEHPAMLNDHQVEEKFIEFLDRYIGKAKLIPGKHHLLFGPWIVRYMYRLISCYENAITSSSVDRLRRVMIEHLEQANGVPQYAREYVKHQLGGRFVDSLVLKQRDILQGRYRDRLYRRLKEQTRTVSEVILTKLPTFGALKKTPLTAPWSWKPVTKDTTENH